MSNPNNTDSVLPAPIVVESREDQRDVLLRKEWLIVNRIGAYASSTVIGCNTRRYHGLLVAATSPPVGRITALSSVMEQLLVGDNRYELATNEFAGTFSPNGLKYLAEFRNDMAPTFVYRVGEAQLTKEIALSETANAVAVRYTLLGGPADLILQPFVALRDYHELPDAAKERQLTFDLTEAGVVVQDRHQAAWALNITAEHAEFRPDPQWWYRFLYRMEIARGQDGFEDLYTPGEFRCRIEDGQCCQLTVTLGDPVSVDFPGTVRRRRRRCTQSIQAVGADCDETTRRLAAATEPFLVRRTLGKTPFSTTILAGFHWFADWGRDTFISLPGLLLATGRFAQARQTFATFAKYIAEGMIPNRFDDSDGPAHYNSIDASLWFIIAAERYLQGTDDLEFWRELLMPAAHTILTAYQKGTDFAIHADADGLLAGGSARTQLTWMDAALGHQVITPRHGDAVEVNALWYSAHRIMARRCGQIDAKLAGVYEDRSGLIRRAFAKTFWNPRARCLYDCVTDGVPDPAIRPNQIFAVSLPHSPLSVEQQQGVVATVEKELLTPFGLRTLSPRDERYCPRYEGTPEQRDRAYHQGTVWPWLMGAFIEAYLKVRGYKGPAVAQAARWLEPFDGHLGEAGLGYISEIFDADSPHNHRGCIAQAWSVAEILRAKLLVSAAKRGDRPPTPKPKRT